MVKCTNSSTREDVGVDGYTFQQTSTAAKRASLQANKVIDTFLAAHFEKDVV